MNVFAKFDEIPSMILEVIKETKHYGQTVFRTDNVKTVYPPTNTVCGGYNDEFSSHDSYFNLLGDFIYLSKFFDV